MNPELLLDLERFAKSVEYGKVTVELTRFQGKTTKAVFKTERQTRPRRFDSDPNPVLTSQILALVKAAKDNQFTGDVPITPSFKKGRMVKLTERAYDERDYK